MEPDTNQLKLAKSRHPIENTMKSANIFFLFAFAMILTIGCARTEPIVTAMPPKAGEPIKTNAANADQTTANKPVAINAAATQKTTPDALVKELYRQHDKNLGPFDQTKNRALADKYFAKPLADLVWQNANRVISDESDVDPDPLYDGGQDSQVKKFAIGQPLIKGNEAVVIASFLDFGKKRAITFELVQENQNWKIANIKYLDGNSLLDFYRGESR